MTIELSDVPLPSELVLIGDKRLKGSGDVVTRYYAGTGESTGDIHLAGKQDLDDAVAAARAAFPKWRALPASERRDMMLRAASILSSRADRLAQLAAVDAGLVADGARGMVRTAVEWLTYYAGWVDKAGMPTVPTDPYSLDYVRNEPYGVIGVISPANSSVSAMILAPLLAAGNCAVIKPSQFTAAVTAEYLQVFVDAGMPPGVVNSIPGGADIGDALVKHPDVNKIHFTGSCSVGAKVSALAATLHKSSGLELGGKSANIVFPDAPLDAAAELVMRALVRQSGQSCVAGTRIIVHESVAEDLLSRTIALTRSQKVGDPLASDTKVGPVVSAASCDRILSVITKARERGDGKVVLGGERLGGELAGGYFIAPTIFTDVDHKSPLAQQETFGPVISFITFRTDDEAVEIANDSEFGLAAYIQTTDLRRAHRTAAQLDVGTIWVNGAVGILAGTPFGGAKNSGLGRVGGFNGLLEFTQAKNIWVGGL
jgi:aldehyde dehydrogenase (NAD+)